MSQDTDRDVSLTIYDGAMLCSDLFDQILEPTGNGSQWLLAEELRGRFGLWAAYVGVYAAKRASLDARLDGHKKIKSMVLELVEMVEKNLRWGNYFLPFNPVMTDQILNMLQN